MQYNSKRCIWYFKIIILINTYIIWTNLKGQEQLNVNTIINEKHFAMIDAKSTNTK